MIEELYTRIGQAFESENYYKVIKLVNKALKISEFGFNMQLLYKYGYSLIMSQKIKEGTEVLNFIALHDNNPHMLSQISRALTDLKRLTEVALPIEEYLSRGNELKAGLVVYLDSAESIENESPDSRNYINFQFMIWKLEGNRAYAFPIRRYEKYGYILKKSNYFKREDLTVRPDLLSFDINSITRIDFALNDFDYNLTIKDLYERQCVFGTINDAPKNHFIRELEQKIAINIGDIIALYNISNKYRSYYYVVDIDTENGVYKAVAISHSNGEIVLKSDIIEEIPFKSYIMEVVNVSNENKNSLNEAVQKIAESKRNI